MSLIGLVLALIVIGILLGLLNYYGPQLHLDGKILTIINIVVVIAVILWLLNLVGLLPLANGPRVPRVQ